MNGIVPMGTALLATADHRRAEDMVLSFQNDFEMYEEGKCSVEGAREVLQHTLPSRHVVASALDAIRQDIDTEPPLDKRLDIVGIMLDVQGVTASDDYIRFLAHKLN